MVLFYFQQTSTSPVSNEAQKEQELQRRHHEQLRLHQQKLLELQGQIQAHHAVGGGVGAQSLMFPLFLEQLRGLQPGAIPPGIAKSPLANHVRDFSNSITELYFLPLLHLLLPLFLPLLLILFLILLLLLLLELFLLHLLHILLVLLHLLLLILPFLSYCLHRFLLIFLGPVVIQSFIVSHSIILGS